MEVINLAVNTEVIANGMHATYMHGWITGLKSINIPHRHAIITFYPQLISFTKLKRQNKNELE